MKRKVYRKVYIVDPTPHPICAKLFKKYKDLCEDYNKTFNKKFRDNYEKDLNERKKLKNKKKELEDTILLKLEKDKKAQNDVKEANEKITNLTAEIKKNKEEIAEAVKIVSNPLNFPNLTVYSGGKTVLRNVITKDKNGNPIITPTVVYVGGKPNDSLKTQENIEKAINSVINLRNTNQPFRDIISLVPVKKRPTDPKAIAASSSIEKNRLLNESYLQGLGFVNSIFADNKVKENQGIQAIRDAVNKNISKELLDKNYKLPKDLKFQQEQLAFYKKGLYSEESKQADKEKVAKYKKEIGDLNTKIDNIEYVLGIRASRLAGIKERSEINSCDPPIVECENIIIV